jgi:predicted ArsR family transcriptional regulator
MRDVGLLEMATDAPSGVGRPQNLYRLSPDAPALGLEPPAFPRLARMLVRSAAAAGLDPEELAEAGREQGRADAAGHSDAPSCLEALVEELAVLGFDPEVGEGDDEDTAVVCFAHCPYRELAEAHPDVVCALHRGIVEGFVEGVGGGHVEAFHSLVHRQPCRVAVSAR